MAYDCLKNEQRKAILKVLQANHCFISLTIGCDKCLIFQVVPFVIECYRRYEDSPPGGSLDFSLMVEHCKRL